MRAIRSERCSCKDYIKINLTEIGGRGLDSHGVGWVNVAGSSEENNEISVSIKVGKFRPDEQQLASHEGLN
jgi:hypothetical protein